LVVGGVRRGCVVVGPEDVVVVVVTVFAGASVDVVVVACSVVVVVVVSVDSEGVHADATRAIARTMSVWVVRVTAGAVAGATMERLLDWALVPAR
jgi:hypothetical protein